MKVCHLTSVHTRYDTRIFIKMCTSLAKQGYKAYLLVADGLGDEFKNSVNIIDAGKVRGGRLNRMTKTVIKIFRQAKEIDADVYHLHDPELLPLVSKLKHLNKKIIFDAHEDLPKQILSKPYLNKSIAFIVSKAVSTYEKAACRSADYIIAATPTIREKFLRININTIDINNYPLVNELYSDVDWAKKSGEVCFVGGLSRIRGIKELVNSLELNPNIKLTIAGEFSEPYFEQEVKSMSGWKKVNFIGFQDRENTRKILARSKAGIVTFLPLPNHIESQPNKMFEYMSAGLPVISSNFPLWKEIVEGNNCGICVDPENPQEIAEAISFFLTHDEEAKKMGENGRRAIFEKYNWETEEKKLFQVYKQLLGI